MPTSDFGKMPWWLWRSAPTTRETKQVTERTEVGIPALQAVAIACLFVVGGALSLAALVSWGRTDWQPALSLFLGVGLTVIVIYSMAHLGRTAQEGQASSLQALAGVLLLVILGLVGLGALFVGGRDLLARAEGLDVEIVCVGVAFGGGCCALMAGIALVRRGLQAAMLFMGLIGGLTAFVYWRIPLLALTAWWPWLLTFLALGVDTAGVYLFRAFRRELVNPYLPLPPHEQIMLEWLERTLPESPSTEIEEREPILLNPPRRDQKAERLERFSAFLHAAALDSSYRRLENLGFSRANEIEPWRDLLIRSGDAEWESPASRKQGWRLTHYPEEILRRLTTADLEQAAPPLSPIETVYLAEEGA